MSPRRKSALWCLLALAGVGAGTRPVEAQPRRTTFFVAGFPYTATAAQGDFANGFLTLGTSTFTVDLTVNGGPGFSPRVTTVFVACGTPCPISGTLPAAQLEWRRADLGTWNPISTAFAIVETRTAQYQGTNDPWGNSIEWRYVLDYATTAPQTGTQFQVRFQMTVAAP